MQLGPHEDPVLEDYRDSLVPPQRAERNWDALLRRIEAGDEPRIADTDELDAAEVAPQRSATPVWFAAAAAVLVAATLATAWAVNSDRMGDARPSVASVEPTDSQGAQGPELGANTGEPAVQVFARVRRTVGRRLPVVPEPEVTWPELESWTRDFQVGVAADTAARSSALSTGPSQKLVRPAPAIAAEARLIGGARAALRDEEPTLALRLLERHARQFERGVMAEERRALRVAALCQAGDASSARREAADFLRDYRDSPLAANVARSCEREPSHR